MIPSTQKSNRKQLIISEINNAKYCIWIAEDWFDDKDIYSALIEKARQGLNVEIILLGNDAKFDNDTLNYRDFMEAGGELYYMNEEDCKSIKFKEFCIIDFKTVIYGDYRNNRHSYTKDIAIFKNYKLLTSTLTDEYMSMKNNFSKSMY